MLQLMRLAVNGHEAILPRTAFKDRGYSTDVAESVVALFEASNREHSIFNIGPGKSWPLSEWADLLRRRYPNFHWRIADAGEMPNVDCFGDRDRAPLATGRLTAATGRAASSDAGTAFADFITWFHSDRRLFDLMLEEHPR